jgi:hypothetical protein
MILFIFFGLLFVGANGYFVYTTFIHSSYTTPQSTPSELYANVTARKPAFDDPLNAQSVDHWDQYKDIDTSSSGKCNFMGDALTISLK